MESTIMLLAPNFEPVVVGWIGSTIGVALHTLAHYALGRPKTWFAYKNYTKKQYSSGINIRKTYKVQRSCTEHENNIIFICVWKSRYFGLVNNLNPNLGQLPLKKNVLFGENLVLITNILLRRGEIWMLALVYRTVGTPLPYKTEQCCEREGMTSNGRPSWDQVARTVTMMMTVKFDLTIGWSSSKHRMLHYLDTGWWL